MSWWQKVWCGKKSGWQNVWVAKCLFFVKCQNVWVAKCRSAKMSQCQNVAVPKCCVAKMLCCQNVVLPKCCVAKLSCCHNVVLPKCRAAKMTVADVLFAKLSSAILSVNRLTAWEHRQRPFGQRLYQLKGAPLVLSLEPFLDSKKMCLQCFPSTNQTVFFVSRYTEENVNSCSA